VDQLLVLEREVSASPVAQRVRLDDLAREVAASMPRVELGELAPAVVPGDAEALRRALVNLVENAMVHGPPDGPVRLRVTLAGERARLAVSDSGPGPDPADGDRIFQRFWRGRTANGRPGSGLGLSIVASIVARHQGTISVDGATFLIELPLVD
jgi:signal transduction histidine kinase